MSDLRINLLGKLARTVTAIQSGVLYLLTVIVLALTSFGFLLYEFLPTSRPEIISVGIAVDQVVAIIFLIDFFLGLFFNNKYKTRGQYWKYNWLDFVSSVPISSEITQALRVLRVWRATKIFRVALNIWTAKQQSDIHRLQKIVD